MNLFIIGANGRTGTHLVDLALRRGHHVTAFVRDAAKIERTHENLKIAVGNPREADVLTDAMRGHDAVCTALGIHELAKTTLLQDCMRATLEAMQRSGVSRLSLVSAATLFPERGPLLSLVRFILRHQVADLAAAEELARNSAVEWTFARPPRLVESPSERYRFEANRLPRSAWSLSFRAVAAFMLDSLEKHAHVREAVGLAA